MYKCKHFDIKELVSKIVYNAWNNKAWMFFDVDILQDLDTIRESWGRAIFINNWYNGGSLSQCGLRSNLDPLMKNKTTLYLTAHSMGKGFDLHDSKGDNKGLYNHVYNLISNKRLKKFCRLENYKNTSGWVHVDSFQSDIIVF